MFLCVLFGMMAHGVLHASVPLLHFGVLHHVVERLQPLHDPQNTKHRLQHKDETKGGARRGFVSSIAFLYTSPFTYYYNFHFIAFHVIYYDDNK